MHGWIIAALLEEMKKTDEVGQVEVLGDGVLILDVYQGTEVWRRRHFGGSSHKMCPV